MTQKSKIPAECTKEINNPIIPLEEKGKKMIFHNKNRKVIKKIQVDNCAIKEGKRCDWLVIDDKNYEHFVELKGSDVVHACEQLSISITKLSSAPTQAAKHSFIIESRVIPAITTTIQNLQRRFKDKFKCKLVIKNRQHEFEL